MVIIFFFF